MDELTDWYLRHVTTPEALRAEGILQSYLDAHTVGLFERLGFAEHLERPRTAAGLAADLGYGAQGADVALEALLRRLAESTGRVSVEAGRFVAAPNAASPSRADLAPLDLETLRGEMADLGDDHLAALDFLDYGAEHFAEALGENEDLLDEMLAGRSGDPETEELWFRATNVDPLQDVHGRFGAQAILELFGGGTVLEVGGGTGNGLRHVLATLAEAGELERIERYHFTDISVGFLKTTRREMKRAYPGLPLVWRGLDVNRPLGEQRIENESLDLIYAVNSAHVARDLVGFLRSCREALRPGGRVLFSERIRRRPGEMAPRELTLNLSPYHRGAAERDPEYRPDHCYLTPEGWLRAFELAGLAEGAVLPDLDRVSETFPGAYAVVVTAVRH